MTPFATVKKDFQIFPFSFCRLIAASSIPVIAKHHTLFLSWMIMLIEAFGGGDEEFKSNIRISSLIVCTMLIRVSHQLSLALDWRDHRKLDQSLKRFSYYKWTVITGLDTRSLTLMLLHSPHPSRTMHQTIEIHSNEILLFTREFTPLLLRSAFVVEFPPLAWKHSTTCSMYKKTSQKIYHCTNTKSAFKISSAHFGSAKKEWEEFRSEK